MVIYVVSVTQCVHLMNICFLNVVLLNLSGQRFYFSFINMNWLIQTTWEDVLLGDYKYNFF